MIQMDMDSSGVLRRIVNRGLLGGLEYERYLRNLPHSISCAHDNNNRRMRVVSFMTHNLVDIALYEFSRP